MRRCVIRALPALAHHVTRTMPWAALFSGCLTGTGILGFMAFVADRSHSPLNPAAVRLAFLPVLAGLAFVPRATFRPLTQATPVPAWLSTAGQTLFAVPVLAVTGWVQLRLVEHTIAGPVPAIYPLVAQLVGWSALTLAAATCCDRSRYAELGGAVAAPISFAIIAACWYTPAIHRFLVAPPAKPHASTAAWGAISLASLVVIGAAMRDLWHRYQTDLGKMVRIGDRTSSRRPRASSCGGEAQEEMHP